MSAPVAAAVLSSTRDKCGESPAWSVREQALYWADIAGQRIHRLDWATRVQQTWHVHEHIGCIALSARAERTVIAAMTTGIFEVTLLNDAPNVRMRCLALATHPEPAMRFNDGRCDAAGRLWVGNMISNMSLAQRRGAMYCLDADGLRGPIAGVDGMVAPNGTAFSPDLRRAYLSDSHVDVQTVWTFDFDLARGEWDASSKRIFADFAALPGRPDGAAIDSQGRYWICANDAAAVLCLSPTTGQVLRSVPVPVPNPTMCCFGGPQLEHLFVCSRPPNAGSPPLLPPLDALDASAFGALFVLIPGEGARGLPEPEFSQYPRVESDSATAVVSQ